VVASQDRAQHMADLEELFVTISKYCLKLNPEKCVFGVEAGKLLGFMLTERGIEANPDKCAAIIAMRSPTSVKEVQQLTRRMAALSRFVSAGGEKGHSYFQCLKRNSCFAWTDECEAAFIKLKEYLATPPVLCKPVTGVPLRLYFAVTERAISSVLVQEQDQIQKPIYFVSKALQGAETRYQALEKAALAVVFSARRLRHYFHSFTVVVMTTSLYRRCCRSLTWREGWCAGQWSFQNLTSSMSPEGPSKGRYTQISWQNSRSEAHRRWRQAHSGRSQWMAPPTSKEVVRE